jgi:hypothetical protein
MLSRYHQGSATTLNVFVTKFKNNDALGYTMNFPVDLAKANPRQDGIILDYQTLLGLPDNMRGANNDYNQGKTLVHEAGKSKAVMLLRMHRLTMRG